MIFETERSLLYFIVFGGVNPLHAKFFRENKNMHLHFMSFLHNNKTQVVEIPPQDKDLPTLHDQYHGCWWPGDARSQGISNHDFDLVKPS